MTDYDAALITEDGQCYFGNCVGATGTVFGELCFTTAMTGYQEAISDPSFAGQIVLFTAPHIGNMGTNNHDNEATKVSLKGVIMREYPTEPSGHRAEHSLRDFLRSNNIVAISGIDTRALTLRIRGKGLYNCAITSFNSMKQCNTEQILHQIRSMSFPTSVELVSQASAIPMESRLDSDKAPSEFNVVLINYGVKSNIIRVLTEYGCSVKVMPHDATYEEILQDKPDGIVLSNGPGDPVEMYNAQKSKIDKVVRSGYPVLGICLGHQIIGLSLGCKTVKMEQGHRGINHPIKCLKTGAVSVVTQNHGFAVELAHSAQAEITHISLFDGTVAGIQCPDLPVFSVQYHPEASPGPHDNYEIFKKFIGIMNKNVENGIKYEN